MRATLRKLSAPTWFLVAAVVLAFWMWMSDFVTIQGERTIYTADCRGGQWQGLSCTGTLAAGNRFRFRALPPHNEVLFWTAGASDPSGRFTQCAIRDGRNWACPGNAEAKRTITLALVKGEAVHDTSGQTQPFHAIGKWRWLLLRAGIPTGNAADY
jgi:hypothetical protein